MSVEFAQDFSSMEPFKDSIRWVLNRPRTPPCVVRVANGELTVTQEPGGLVVQVPTAGLEIVTPGRIRKLAAGVVLQLGGKPVAIMFDLVYARQRFLAASQQGQDAVRQAAKFGASTKGNLELASQITPRFLAALLAGGAIDRTGPA